MKQFKITYHENGVTKYLIISAKNKDEATNKAWRMIDADDIYVNEVENND